MAWVVPVAMGVASLYKMYQDNQNEQDIQKAGQAKLQNVGSAVNILNNYRQTQRQQGLNALNNQMGAYQGASNVLASMYGPMGSSAPNTSLAGGGPSYGPPKPMPSAPFSSMTQGPIGMGGAAPPVQRLPPRLPAPAPGSMPQGPIGMGGAPPPPPGGGALPGGLANLASLFRGKGP